jgi:D-alanyl-lipoteichoic acid acyltransferase DltB (MBOAT superfamily)
LILDSIAGGGRNQPTMLFQSQEFVLLLLPVTLALYYLFADRPRARQAILILSSLVFYGWWDARFVPLLIAHCTVAWAGPKLAQITGRRAFIDAAIALQFLSLATFKYSNFVIVNVEQILNVALPRAEVLLPIGISFYTFQLVSYLIDVRRGTAPAHPLWSILLYISFFPHLIAGPIVRHNELLPQFAAHPLRPGMAERFGKGLTLFIIGMAKKVLLADPLALVADPIFAADVSGTQFGAAWTGALAFTFQLFLDFSAYSEMAIGLALMFGLLLPENFRNPYRATSLRDFWRRWHITLATFLRDYVYVPLGGNRQGRPRYVLAIMVTMGACGLWHGAGWTYVSWGVLHGAGLIVCAAYQSVGRPLPSPVGWLLTMLFVIAGWVIFRAPNFSVAYDLLTAMAGFNGFEGRIRHRTLLVVAAAVSLLLPSSHELIERWLRPLPAIAVPLAATFAFMMLRINTDTPVAFIYFQF